MGTYTTNYQLYTPTVGETGWGTLVNGNFTTIDTTMKGLDTRLTAVENEVNGNLSCTSITTSGKITGNGGIAGTTGTFSSAVTGASFNGVGIKSSGTYTVTPNSTKIGYILPTGDRYTMILPPWGGKYSGSIKFYASRSGGTGSSTVYVRLRYYDGNSEDTKNLDWTASSGDNTLTFTNIPYLLVARSTTSTSSIGGTSILQYYGFTLT